jgi:hypothetical protein
MALLDSLSRLHDNSQLPNVVLISTNNAQIALDQLQDFIQKAFGINLSKYNTNSLLLKPQDSGNINIDQVRKLTCLLQQTSTDLVKVAAIYQADCMNISSANAALKLLEEPTDNTYIFLISSKIESILPTIRSRCYKLRCDYLRQDPLVQYHEFISLLALHDILLILEKFDFKSHQKDFADSCLLFANKMIKFRLSCALDLNSQEEALFSKLRPTSSIQKLISCYDEIYSLTTKAANHDLEFRSIAILLLEAIYEHIGNRN